MSEFITDEVKEQIRSVRVAKHVVMRSILKEHLSPDTNESTINDLLMRIYQLFYDSSMVSALFSDIQEREKQKQELQEMELEDIAKLAFDEASGEVASADAEFAQLLEADETAFESMMALSDKIDYEVVYQELKKSNIHFIIDFFSAFQGSTSSLWETTSELSDLEKKNVLDIFGLFVEKQMETESETNIGKNLSSVLNIDIADKPFYIFMYAPKKWLDKGMTHRLSIGLMIREDWAKYITTMSKHIAKKMNEISNLILGATGEDLSNISFRLVDITFRKMLKSKIKEVSEYFIRSFLAWDQIQSSTTL